MSDDDRMSGALQENLLTLLCFSDQYAKLIRASVTVHLFEGAVFKEIAGLACDFLDQFGEPIKDHLPDQLEHILRGDDARKAANYERVVTGLFDTRESVNGEYVVSQLNKFVRQQVLKDAVIKAVEHLNDDKIDEAELALHAGLKSQITSFSGGTSLTNPDDIFAAMEMVEEEGIFWGIDELDNGGIIPRRKELTAILAPRGKGKSWAATHLAKRALLQRWSALIVTLEMSEKRYTGRMLQSFFSVSRGNPLTKITRIKKDGSTVAELIREEIERPILKDSATKAEIRKKAKKTFGNRVPLRIKEFPTNDLTLPKLEAYLDGLERFENFTPDLIIVDYPGLMKIDPNNLRLELGKIIEGLRGIGVQRNAAIVTLHQGNRASETAQLVTGDMAAEDISVLATADQLITYSQTMAEYRLGLARLFVEKARNDEGKQIVLISQAYNLGQFCLESAHIVADDYWDLVTPRNSDRDDDEPAERPRSRRRERP